MDRFAPTTRNVLARVVVCASLALGSGIISGCGLSSEPLPDDVQFASYAPQGTGGNSAALIGVLKVTDGCLVLEQEADSPASFHCGPTLKSPGPSAIAWNSEGGFTENSTLATIPPACARLSLPMFLVNS